MRKQLTYLEETNLNFYSRPVHLVIQGTEWTALTDTHTLIWVSESGEKRSHSLSKLFPLERKEKVVVFEPLPRSQFLVMTSKLRVFRLETDPKTGEPVGLVPLAFPFAKTIKSVNKVTAINKGSFVLVQMLKFIFLFSAKDGQFRIFKMFNEVLLDMQAVGEALFVLTTQALHKFQFLKGDLPIAPVLLWKEAGVEAVQMAISGAQGFLLHEDGSASVVDLETQKVADVVELRRPSGESVSVAHLIPVEGGRTVLANAQHGFLLSSDLKSVENVFRLDECDFVLGSRGVVDLNKSTENSFKTQAFRSISYTKDSRHNTFYRQNPATQLALVSAHLSRKLFKRLEVPAPIPFLKQLLDPLCLKASVLKHPKFKDRVYRFFRLVKEFTSQLGSDADAGFQVDCPVLRSRLSLPELPEPDAISHVTVDFLSAKSDKKSSAVERETDSTSTSSKDPQDDAKTVSSRSSPLPTPKLEPVKLINPPTLTEMGRRQTPRDLRIIANNLRRPTKVVSNPFENQRILRVRAENRVVRLNRGRGLFHVILRKEGVSLSEKLWFCFFVFEKFEMRRSFRQLFRFILARDLRVSLSRAARVLNSRAVFFRGKAITSH